MINVANKFLCDVKKRCDSGDIVMIIGSASFVKKASKAGIEAMTEDDVMPHIRFGGINGH